MKTLKRISAILFALLFVFSSAITAYAAVPPVSSPNTGGYYDGGYVFYLGSTTRYIPYGTVCSMTYNAHVYYYVHTIQYILYDIADYHQNLGYHPGAVDGDFGPNTKSAVQYYQGQRGLTVDGCVGDQTWSSFVSFWVFG